MHNAKLLAKSLIRNNMSSYGPGKKINPISMDSLKRCLEQQENQGTENKRQTADDYYKVIFSQDTYFVFSDIKKGLKTKGKLLTIIIR